MPRVIYVKQPDEVMIVADQRKIVRRCTDDTWNRPGSRRAEDHERPPGC